jgi:hypothetical protein
MIQIKWPTSVSLGKKENKKFYWMWSIDTASLDGTDMKKF